MEVLPIEQLRAMTPEEINQLAKAGTTLETKATKATESHKSSFPAMGKVVCVVEERLNLLKSERDENGQPKKRQIPASTSLAEYWKGVVGNKEARMNPHYLSCAVAFGTYVRCDLIAEKDYDKNTGECLELAASISTKCAHDVTHEAILKAAAELKDRSKDSRKVLKAILESIKGVKPMDADKARELFAQIVASGHLNSVVIPAIGAEIAHFENDDAAHETYFGLETAMSMFYQNAKIGEAAVDVWIKAIELRNIVQQATAKKAPANAPVQHVKAGVPVLATA